MPTIAAARPYPFEFSRPHLALLLIDMQRDFIEPGGFGSALGNDVARLAAILPPTARLLNGFRRAGLPVCHTREAHHPDLADCPPSKLRRGNAALRIGDRGPMGRILISGELGTILSRNSSRVPANGLSRNPARAPSLPPGLMRSCASAS